MKPIDYKTKLIDKISVVNDDDTLQKLYSIVHSFIENNNKSIKDKEPSFEEWNEQFKDDLSLDNFIPEYGTTLKEFRMSIYEAETSHNFLTEDEFRVKIQRW